MEIRRFFVTPDKIVDNEIIVDGDEFQHMTKVLRYKVGFKAIVCANDGYEHSCTITKLDRNQATLKIDESKLIDKKNIKLVLFAGLLKNNKLDLVVQKSVELGVDTVIPFTSAYCDESKFRLDRAQTIAKDAAKQCGTTYLTNVEDLISFDEVVKRVSTFDTVLFAYENEINNSINKIDIVGKNIAIIVGPEGGFKVEELKAIKDAGAKVITLGKRILRAETASIVLSTLVLNKLGELDYD